MAQDRITQEYRNHFLVAVRRDGRCRGRALRDDRPLFDVEGGSIPEVLELLRERVDQKLDALSETRKLAPANAEDYVQAFQSILPRLTDGHRAMLKAHFHAPDQTITATELAAAAGYENYSAANLQYGFVGKLVYEELLCDLPSRPDGTRIYTFAIASGVEEGTREGEWRWVLRPQAAAAIERLGLHA